MKMDEEAKKILEEVKKERDKYLQMLSDIRVYAAYEGKISYDDLCKLTGKISFDEDIQIRG